MTLPPHFDPSEFPVDAFAIAIGALRERLHPLLANDMEGHLAAVRAFCRESHQLGQTSTTVRAIVELAFRDFAPFPPILRRALEVADECFASSGP